MSTRAFDTVDQFFQFVAAYEADYVTPDGRLVIDDPNIRQKLVAALDAYTAIYRKGCSRPNSVNWSAVDNNKAFLAQTVVMTPNVTLSIPNALKTERPEDYHENTATLEWPLGPSGKEFSIFGFVASAVVFKGASNIANAEEFVRFLVREGWLAHYLNFSAERYLPALPALLAQPFWLDSSDRHRMAAAMQVASRALMYDYVIASGDWRYDQIRYEENVWAKVIHRRRRRGHRPRAGGRRGDRPDQADPGGVSDLLRRKGGSWTRSRAL